MHRFGSALLALGACAGDEDADPPDTGAVPSLTVLGDDATLPEAALKSIWGTEDDMFLAGADDGTGPVVLRWDGSGWERLETGTSGGLWWVWSLPGSDRVWFGGDGARMLTYSRSSGTFTEAVIASPAYSLFGVWGSSETDIWAVGGDINGGNPGIVVHWDGASWGEPLLVEPDGQSPRQAYKVWGSGADDVWVVGTRALFMRWDGASWQTLPQPVYQSIPFFTLSGTGADDITAVGGEGNARTVHWDGSAWLETSPPPSDIVPGLVGVASSADHGVVACGTGGSIYWREDTRWVIDPRNPGTARDFHACWIDDAGALWAVGGDLSEQDEGVVVYGGDRVTPFSR